MSCASPPAGAGRRRTLLPRPAGPPGTSTRSVSVDTSPSAAGSHHGVASSGAAGLVDRVGVADGVGWIGMAGGVGKTLGLGMPVGLGVVGGLGVVRGWGAA